jgi:hypothetical protein
MAQTPLGWLGLPVPRKERFGFPYQAGWKAVGELFASQRLQGSYDSNENPQITWWYTRGAWRCTADPRYYVIADQVQDEIEPPRRRIATDYAEIASISVAGQARTRIYEHKPITGSPIGQIDVAHVRGSFDRDLSQPMVDPGVWARGVISPLMTEARRDFPVARFIGYRLFEEEPRPGGVVRVDAYWKPAINGERYIPVLTLGDDPTLGTSDGPGCDKSRSWAEWREGQPFAQRVSLPIASDAQPGRYPLTIRLVDTETGKLVPSRENGAEVLPVGEITVRS